MTTKGGSVEDPNAVVAKAVCVELVRLGIVSVERVKGLEKSIRDGTVSGEQWRFAIEASLEPARGARDDAQG